MEVQYNIYQVVGQGLTLVEPHNGQSNDLISEMIIYCEKEVSVIKIR